jgi:pimeloyl-ACP methyl ester carboxylesterase
VRLVLLPGVGSGPEAWQPQIEAFGAQCEVLTPRLRLDGEFTVEREAERLWQELPGDPVELCGLSLGALVAMQMALLRPDRVERLALCAGFARLPVRGRLLMGMVGAAAGLVPARLRGELGGLERRAVRAVFRAGRRFDASGELGRLTMPTLVLYGERDRANAALSEWLAGALPDGRESHSRFAARRSSRVAAHCSGVKSNGEARCSIGTITPQPGRTSGGSRGLRVEA